MDDEKRDYKIHINGVPIQELGLSETLEIAFRSRNYLTAESVYGGLISSPDVFRSFLAEESDVNYENLIDKLRSVIPQKTLEEIDRLNTSSPNYSMGVLPPTVHYQGKIIRREDYS